MTLWLRRIAIACVAALVMTIGAGVSTTTTPVAAADPSSCSTTANIVTGGGCTVLKKLGGAAAGAAKDAASSAFQGIVKSIIQGTAQAMVMVLTWFVRIPTPEASKYSAIEKVKDLTLRLQLIFMAISIIVGGIRLMLAKRAAVYAAGEEQFHSLARAVIGAWMFGGVVTALGQATDALSTAWLNDVTKGDASKVVERIINVQGLLALNTGFVLIVGILGALGAIFQAVILVIRQAMLILVVAIIPIVGAASGTELGKMAFSRMVRWTLALLLWKLVAALVFVVAFTLAGASAKTTPEQVFYGFILLFLSALVLPMLMKLVSSGLSMSGGSGLQAGMMAAGTAAAVAGMVATGGASAAAGGGGAASTAGSAGATGGVGASGSSGAGGGDGGGVTRMSAGSGSSGGADSSGGSGGGARDGSNSQGAAAAASAVPAAATSAQPSASGGGSSSTASGSAAGGSSGGHPWAQTAAASTAVLSTASQAFYAGADPGHDDGDMR